MSYVRWSGESLIYVFEHVDGYVTCFDCCLNDFDPVNTDSTEEMLAHLEEHVAAGHNVPGYVVDNVRKRSDR